MSSSDGGGTYDTDRTNKRYQAKKIFLILYISCGGGCGGAAGTADYCLPGSTEFYLPNRPTATANATRLRPHSAEIAKIHRIIDRRIARYRRAYTGDRPHTRPTRTARRTESVFSFPRLHIATTKIPSHPKMRTRKKSTPCLMCSCQRTARAQTAELRADRAVCARLPCGGVARRGPCGPCAPRSVVYNVALGPLTQTGEAFRPGQPLAQPGTPKVA